jgi:hypothetical protein
LAHEKQKQNKPKPPLSCPPISHPLLAPGGGVVLTYVT